MKNIIKKLFIVAIALYGCGCINQSYAQKMIGGINDNTDNSYYCRMNGVQDNGVYIKNKNNIEIKNIYINIADTPQASMPFIIRIIQGKTMNKSHYLYYAKDFKDIIPPIECQAKGSGIYTIDMSKYNLEIEGDFIVIPYHADSDLEDYKYIHKTAVPKLKPNGDFSGYKNEDVEYMGPSFITYSKSIDKLFVFIDFGDKYSFLNRTKGAPMIAIQTN